MVNDRERRRFWTRVRQSGDGCWIWAGGLRSNGYGSFAVKHARDGRWTFTTAHRWAFMDQVFIIGNDLEVDHLCRVRACVRPDHLEAVTVAENRRRRDIKYAPPVDRTIRPIPAVPVPPPPEKRNLLTHCKNGHAYADRGWAKNGKGRTCAACREAQNARKRTGTGHGTETHCPYGHPYSGENLYVKPSGGRECRTCIRARAKRA